MSKIRWHKFVKRRCRWLALFAALPLTLALAGCGSMLGSMPLIGEPAYTPPRPAERPAFPAVGEAGSSRSTKLMTPAERAKLEADLAAARANSVQERRNQISAPDD